MMVTDSRTRSVLLLVSGMAAGALLAVFTLRTGGDPLTSLTLALPFLLAVLTGVAKTTTA
jgi:hypothetical protein